MPSLHILTVTNYRLAKACIWNMKPPDGRARMAFERVGAFGRGEEVERVEAHVRFVAAGERGMHSVPSFKRQPLHDSSVRPPMGTLMAQCRRMEAVRGSACVQSTRAQRPKVLIMQASAPLPHTRVLFIPARNEFNHETQAMNNM